MEKLIQDILDILFNIYSTGDSNSQTLANDAIYKTIELKNEIDELNTNLNTVTMHSLSSDYEEASRTRLYPDHKVEEDAELEENKIYLEKVLLKYKNYYYGTSDTSNSI